MQPLRLKEGAVYIVAGRGDLLLERSGLVCLFLGHGYIRLHLSASEIVREASIKDITEYNRQAKARGVGCEDPMCWCKRMA